MRWVITILVVVGLIVGGLLLNHEQWQTRWLSPWVSSQQDVQPDSPMAPMQGMDMSAPSETKEAPAYSMVTPAKQQLIGVKTEEVRKQVLETTIRAVGRIDYDEQRITHVNLRISGWVEDLFVDYTGQLVHKGQPLFTLYSPELVAAQDEYLLALQAEAQVKDSPLPEVRRQAHQLVDAARDRLRFWTLTNDQINELARGKKTQTNVTIYSPTAGHVIEKKVFKGMFLEPKTTAYTIVDLSTIWVQTEVYEYELPFIKIGEPATLTLAAFPGQSFQGRVSYVYPYMNKETRTVKVRLVLPNPRFLLKPDMYGDVRIIVNRGMKLALPEEAVLSSGTRDQVFVARGENLYEPRELRLGPKVGTHYEVLEGLEEGERIVTSGTFLLDSESKLMATTDMMGALGMGGIKMEQARMGEMDMGGMNMDMGGMNMDMGGMEMGSMDMKMKGTQMASGKPSLSQAHKEQVDDLTLNLATHPKQPRIGGNRITLKVTDKKGRVVSPSKVLLTYTTAGMNPATVPMTPVKDVGYEANVNLGMAGQWDLSVKVERPNQPDVTKPFIVIVKGMPMQDMQGME